MGTQQHAPEPIGEFSVVGAVADVLRKRDCLDRLVWPAAYLNANSEFMQHSRKCGMKIGNRHRLLLITDQLPVTQRKSCIVTRKWLCSNNFCLCMYTVTGDHTYTVGRPEGRSSAPASTDHGSTRCHTHCTGFSVSGT